MGVSKSRKCELGNLARRRAGVDGSVGNVGEARRRGVRKLAGLLSVSGGQRQALLLRLKDCGDLVLYGVVGSFMISLWNFWILLNSPFRRQCHRHFLEGAVAVVTEMAYQASTPCLLYLSPVEES